MKYLILVILITVAFAAAEDAFAQKKSSGLQVGGACSVMGNGDGAGQGEIICGNVKGKSELLCCVDSKKEPGTRICTLIGEYCPGTNEWGYPKRMSPVPNNPNQFELKQMGIGTSPFKRNLSFK